MKILVAYNGSLNSKAALRHGIWKARKHNASLMVLHVFNRSLFIDYEAWPLAEVIARDETLRHLEDAKRIIDQEGTDIPVTLITTEGNPSDEITRFARDEKIDIIFSPQRYITTGKGITCPVCIIPLSPSYTSNAE